MDPRILLLSANFGSGHLQAARSIARACRDLRAGCDASAVNVDHPVLSLVTAGYLKLLRLAPWAYRGLYHAPVGDTTRLLIRSAYSSAVRRELEHVRPTAVVATHPFPAAVAAALRRQGKLTAPVVVTVTDFVPHPLWVHEGVDRYFVATDAAATALAAMDAPPDRIAVSGIPIRPDFKSADHPREGKVRNVLVMGGGLGLGPIGAIVPLLSLLSQPGLRVTVICGQNRALHDDLCTRVAGDQRFELLGNTDQVPFLMARADLLITKPGGLSCSEALASGLPMLLVDPLPGHEEENAEYLATTGAAQLAYGRTAARLAERLLFGPDQDELQQMRACALRAGRPLAARAIARALVG